MASRFLGSAVLAVCLNFSAPALAQSAPASGGQATAAPPVDPPAPDPFAQMVAARQVAEFARRQKDVQAMIVAARMLQEVPFTDKAGSEGADAAAFTPAGLFAEAKTLAAGDRTTLIQIQVAESQGSKGVLTSAFGKGLLRLVKDVAARANYRFDISAQGGTPLRIGAIGDVGTAIVLRLIDTAGRLVCVDDNGDYAPVCATLPRVAGVYHVEVVNRSARPSRAVIVSN